MANRKAKTYSEQVDSILNLHPELNDIVDTNIDIVTRIAGILIEKADNNSYTVINAGTPGVDEERNYYPLGHVMCNESGAVDDFIHYGVIPHGTIFVSVKRFLARNEDVEDPATEGLPEEYAHRINFVLVDKTLKKYLSAQDVANLCNPADLERLEKTLRKRFHMV